MDDWLDGFADVLGVERLTPKEMGALLKLSREVAHGVERKYAPISTFLVGLYVGQRGGESVPRDQQLQEAVDEALRLVPERTEAADEAGGA